jgi:alcohol dehydrogenase YqhD (iron-dependent ADH family)
MMQPFSFSTAGRIIFGNGTVEQVAGEAARMGHLALLVMGSTSHRTGMLETSLCRGGSLIWNVS